MNPISQTQVINQVQVLAQNNLYQARFHKGALNFDMALVFYDQAKAAFKNIAGDLPLSKIKDALNQARMPQTTKDEDLRRHIAEIYFERAQLLEKLDKTEKAQASYKKARAWGHPDVEALLSSLTSHQATSSHTLQLKGPPGKTSDTPHSATRSPSIFGSQTSSTLFDPEQDNNLSAPLLKDIEEKNALIDLLFANTLQTFQALNLSAVLPSAFLVYAHDNFAYGVADAGTAKFLIQDLFKLGVNLYSDQTPKGLQTQASFSTREDAAKVDDILTSQLCLLPTAVGTIKPVDKVIVCGSQVLGHYLQWGEAGQRYQAYCEALKAAYGFGQQNPAQAEAEIRKVVNIYSKQPGFHHVLTEMAFLKIRADYLEQHGIIPISLCTDGYELCFADFINATTVRIEDIPRFAALNESGKEVYENQGRHLVLFKLLEKLLARNDAETLLHTFWTEYSQLIARLSNEASAPKASEYLPVWEKISLKVRTKLQELQTQVDLYELRNALTRYISLDRLAIQRLSGPPLSMKDCYVNLAVVECKQVNKEEEPKEIRNPYNNFDHLRSDEANNSNNHKLISLEGLFNPRKLNDGEIIIPKRILIRGRAGVGKTTLSKKIVYEYTQKGQWRDHFDWLIWIPLRTLKGKSSCDWVKLFQETYFHANPKGEVLAKRLAAHINGPAKDKTLFVLDGWDEVSQEWSEHEPMYGFLKLLLNQPAVLITSRPYVDLKEAQPMDLELETTGFSQADVTAYLDNRNIVPSLHATEVRRFIQSNAFFQELASIPIQMDALCYSWDEIKRIQRETPGSITVTALYQAMTNKLWRKDILRLSKHEVGAGQLLTASHVDALERTSRIEKLVKSEQDFLSALAFHGLQNNQIEFSHYDLHELIEQLEQQGVDLPLTLEDNLKKLSFLYIDDVDQGQYSYHFMHLTFQEFFAAKFLVQHIHTHLNLTQKSTAVQTAATGMQLGVRPSLGELEAFMATHKYNPRYENVWWMVAGLLKGASLRYFFSLLEKGSRDLTGMRHQQVIAGCLSEARSRLDQALIDKLEAELVQWLHFELQFSDQTSKLARQGAFPEHLLITSLNHYKNEEKTTLKILKILADRPILSGAVLSFLITNLENNNETIELEVKKTLQKARMFSSGAIKVLLTALQSEKNDIKFEADRLLVQGKILSDDKEVSFLISMLNDENECISSNAFHILQHQHALSERTISTLFSILKNENHAFRFKIALILIRENKLTEDVIAVLIGVLKNENINKHQISKIRETKLLISVLIGALKNKKIHSSEASEILISQTKSPKDAALTLIPFLENRDEAIRSSAIEILRQQDKLPDEAVLALIPYIKDRNKAITSSAKAILKAQGRLSHEAILALIPYFTETDEAITSSTEEILKAQGRLSHEEILTLISSLKNQNASAKAIINTLSYQGALPSEAISALVCFFRDENILSEGMVAGILRTQKALSDDAILALVTILQDENKFAREDATSALSRQNVLSKNALSTLTSYLHSEKGFIKYAAVTVLGCQHILSEDTISALAYALKDPSPEIRNMAANALGNQKALSDNAILALAYALNDKIEFAIDSVAFAINRQHTLPHKVILILISYLYSRDVNVRIASNWILRHQKIYFKQAVLDLISLLISDHTEAASAAAEILKLQGTLSDNALQVLILHLKNKKEWVRNTITNVLNRQDKLPDDINLVLTSFLKEENDENIRSAAKDVLCSQSALSDKVILALIPYLQNQVSIKSMTASILGNQRDLSFNTILLFLQF